MNNHPRTLTLLVKSVLLLLAFVSSISAQAPDSQTKSQSNSEGIEKRDNEWGVWGGMSFNSTTLIGKTPDVKFGNIGLRYGRVLAASKTVAFEWTIDVIPVSVLSNPRPEVTFSGPLFTITLLVRHSVYGFGAAPIGWKLNFRRNRRVQPFGQATGGFLYFNRQAPVDDSSRFNFTFDFSGGVQIVNGNRAHSRSATSTNTSRTATRGPSIRGWMCRWCLRDFRFLSEVKAVVHES